MRTTIPFHKGRKVLRNGLFILAPCVFMMSFLIYTRPVVAADGAAEALELRFHAEHAIAQEAAGGSAELAEVMQEILPGLLVEHLMARDEGVAIDAVDAAFVQEQFNVAAAMEEPGVAMALDVFAGPGTGYEHGLEVSIASLADFHLRKAGNLPDGAKALEVHERVMEHHLAKLDALGDALDDRLDDAADAAADAADRLADAAEKLADAAADAAKDTADAAKDAADAAEDAADDEEEEEEEEEGGGGGGPPEGKGGGPPR